MVLLVVICIAATTTEAFVVQSLLTGPRTFTSTRTSLFATTSTEEGKGKSDDVNVQASGSSTNTNTSTNSPTPPATNVDSSTDDSSTPTGEKPLQISPPPQPAVSRPRPTSISTPTPELMMRALNTSPRRIVLSSLASSAIALTANFCGVTSNILTQIPESTVEQTGLDTFYPRGDMKRFKSGEHQYTFVVPKEWVQDTAVELAKIQNRAAKLDYSMSMSSRRNTSGGAGAIPDVAYGPPGYFNERGISQSDTNISTLVSPVTKGFTLQSLGSPTEAAETLLRVSLAPPGSGKVATLLAACEEVRGMSNLYQFEYRVDRGEKGLPLRAISIIAVRDGDILVTMTVVSLEREWEDEAFAAKLRKVAQSFKLTK
eukprot:CAMPEP_0203676280 /NCGR_PEP_ID=MMETSP0090-20130426/24164_1 /ASSEMBLY_ACC=CAM_ASM_001088 /TAXON_ID=426623 /ORGANISM="Chaetoceros affinis, Strain CCMP159" /LENGTH=371 /DNA_ID=CAMNT_0050542795 /DNA_START=104 /DNA_END=1219 /DNA_ORIENTATION=+